MTLRIVRIDRYGKPEEPLGELPEMIQTNCAQGAEHYSKVGYVPPWVGYIAVMKDLPVGGGAFVGEPVGGVVEIAYYTVPEHEGRGYASLTATTLRDLARKVQPGIVLVAHTLPEENASTRILAKAGFTLSGIATDPDEGDVWEWRA